MERNCGHINIFACLGFHRIAISAKNIFDASYEKLCVAYVYIYVFFMKKGIPQCTASYMKILTQKRNKIPTRNKIKEMLIMHKGI